MSFTAKTGTPPSVTVKLGSVRIDQFGGYHNGYAAGKADAEDAKAAEDSALLAEINKSIIDAAKNPTSCAETLSDVPESVGKLYDHGYSHGEGTGYEKGAVEGYETGEAAQYIAEIKDGVLYVRTKTYARIENNVLYLKKENTV